MGGNPAGDLATRHAPSDVICSQGKRMTQFGKVESPRGACLAVLKMEA
jgi:hypothetical protein